MLWQLLNAKFSMVKHKCQLSLDLAVDSDHFALFAEPAGRDWFKVRSEV